MSSQFVITLINYANSFIGLAKNTSTTAEMWAQFTSMDPYLQSYITEASR